MKKILIIMIVVQLAAVLGCAQTASHKTDRIDLVNFLVKIKEGENVIRTLDTINAPVLGPVYKEFWAALAVGDKDKAWDMFSSSGKANLTATYTNIDKLNADFERLTKQLDQMNEQGIAGDPKMRLELLILITEASLKARDPRDMLNGISFAPCLWALDPLEVVSETVDGKEGILHLRGKISKEPSQCQFVNEDGVWKLSMQ